MDYFPTTPTTGLLDELDVFTAMHDALQAHVEQHADLVDTVTQSPFEISPPIGTPWTEEKDPHPPPFVPDSAHSVSIAFPPNFVLNDLQPDVILVSSDHVLFFVHRVHLAAASFNAFNGLLDAHPVYASNSHTVLSVPEDSILLNIIIHTIYNLSCVQFCPPLAVLLNAIWSMKTYGMSLDRFIAPGRPLYDHILTETPRLPLEVYTVAAENKIESLAVASSAHLLSLQLPSLSNDVTDRMGTRYFKRLVLLHLQREHVLKRILLEMPQPHQDTTECGFVEQKKLARAWGLAAASLLWQVRPDFPMGVLRSTMGSLDQHLTCMECKNSLSMKIRQIVLEWSETKATI